MIVTILGSGTCIPHAHRASPGLTIELENSTLLVDPSSGSLDRMAKNGLPPTAISHVLFSHYHPDHTGDLVPLLFASRIPDHFPVGHLNLIGPPGLRDFYTALRQVYGHWIEPDESQLDILEIPPGIHEFQGWSVEALPVEHTNNSMGLRFRDSNGVFAYSGDTGYCSNLVDLLRDADVGLVECSHPYEVPGHLTPALAGRAAREAGLKRMILTHLYPSCEGHDLVAEVKESGYDGVVEVASDGMKVIVGP